MREAYRYDGTTGEFLFSVMAQEDPMHAGAYLLPARATFTAPPEAQTGYARVWDGAAWIRKEDHRGVTVWRDWQTSMVIRTIGPIPEGWSTEKPDKPVTISDYDDALEAHLMNERTARGYTSREPDTYVNSSVARWKQDAQDWIAHKDAVMLYGLQVENDYAEGKPVPTLPEFKAALPKIQWTLEMA